MLNVSLGSTTTVYATATDLSGMSPCSTTFVTHKVPARPNTKFKKKPAKVVTYSRAKVPTAPG